MSKKRSSLIDSVEVRVPCEASWDEMVGDDRVRFCRHCAKDVNNISAVTRKQAMRLVERSGGSLCIRYVPDAATGQPVFLDRMVRITRRRPLIAAGVLAASIGVSSMAYSQSDADTDTEAVVARQIREQKELEKQQAMLATTGTIEGYITDAAGKGVAGVHVSASLAGEFLDGEKTTDEKIGRAHV